jgi:acetate kinase
VREPILVINAGSSSIKFSVFETAADRSLSAELHGQVEGIGTAAHLDVSDAAGQKLADTPVTPSDYRGAIAAIHEWFGRHIGSEASFAAAGHRIVHGGDRFGAPVLIDDAVLAALEELVPLAPLHQPHHIAAIRALRAVAPRLPQIACFDTAFHAAQPPQARAFALPRALTEKGIRRYGFHGISYQYIMSVLPQIAPDRADGKIVIAHLGNGASLCAVEHRRSVATTMSFTPLDGLMMGTRAGALDPGVILYLLQHEHMDPDAIAHLLYYQSGLLGVSGISSDMRNLLASDRPSAKEAVDLFVYRIGRELGSLVAALGGLDALVFTAGIGEHAPEIRARVCRDAAWTGLTLDSEANEHGGPLISLSESPIAAFVVPTDENRVIARQTRRLLDQGTVQKP